MKKLNFNHDVIIYPNKRGFIVMFDLVQERYSLTREKAVSWVVKRTLDDGSYRDQLHEIMTTFHPMFYNGQQLFKTMNFKYVK